MNKQLVSFSIMLLLVASAVSAYSWDNSKKFIKDETTSEYGKIQINNLFGLGSTIAEYELLDNTNQCLTNCYAEGTATLYSKGKLFEDLKFKDISSNFKQLQNSKILIRHTEYLTIDVPDYEEQCSGKGNDTICVQKQVKSHKQSISQESWKEYKGEDLEEGTYYWRIEGNKNPTDNLDWIASSNGKDFTDWAWWSSSWKDCKNITIATSLTQNEGIMLANLTGLTFSNITELRIVNAPCYETGSEVKSTALSNDSSGNAYMTFLANLSGSNAVYSVYYNNPTNPVKTLEASPDFCEFDDGTICGWNDQTGGVYSIDNGVYNISGVGTFGNWLGIYSPIDIGNVNVVSRQMGISSDGGFIRMGLTSADNFSDDVPALRIYYDLRGGQDKIYQGTGGAAPNDDNLLSSNDNAFKRSWFNVGSDGILNLSLYSDTGTFIAQINGTNGKVYSNLSLGISIVGNTNPYSVDYIRAYDLEATYVSDVDMPTFTLSDPVSLTLNVDLNSPEDYYNSSSTTVSFNCSANDSTVVGNLSLIIDGDINYTQNGGLGQNISFVTSVFSLSESLHNWTCLGYDINGGSVQPSERYFTVDTTPLGENITIVSADFNASSFKSSTEDYGLNVTYDSLTYTNINATFNYNGTSYSLTKSGSGDYIFFDKQLTLDETLIGNNSLNWTITAENSTGVYYLDSDTYYQDVGDIMFYFCNSSSTVPYINFTFADETNDNQLNASADLVQFDYFIGSGIESFSFYYSNSTENSEYAFCFYPEDQSLNYSVTMQYSSTGYPQRHYVTSGTLTNTTTNIVLKLLGSSDGIYSTIVTATSSNAPVSGVTVQAERQFSGVWTLVEQGTTDSAGAVTFWVNPNFDHRITATKTGYATSQATIRPTQTSYTLILSPISGSSYNYSAEGISYRTSPQQGLFLQTNTTYTFEYNITSSIGNLINYTLEIGLSNGTILNSTEAYDAYGSNISVTVNTMDYGYLIGKYWVDTGDSSFLLDPGMWSIVNMTVPHTSIWDGIKNTLGLYQDTNIEAKYGQLWWLFFFIFIGFAVFSYYTGADLSNPGIMIIPLLFVVWVFSYMGFFNVVFISPDECSYPEYCSITSKWIVAIICSLLGLGYLIGRFSER